MPVNVQVTKNGTENATNTIRRFTKRVQQSGVIKRMKDIRFHKRAPSTYVQKKKALRTLENRKKYNQLSKLGKITPRKRGR